METCSYFSRFAYPTAFLIMENLTEFDKFDKHVASAEMESQRLSLDLERFGPLSMHTLSPVCYQDSCNILIIPFIDFLISRFSTDFLLDIRSNSSFHAL